MKNGDDKIFELAVVNNRLSYVLKGVGAYRIYSNNMNLEAIINTEPVMYKIYDCYVKQPHLKIDEKLQEALEELSQNKDFLSIYTVLDYEKYQLEHEKSQKAPFSLDHLKIFNILRNNLRVNENIFRQQGVLRQYNLEDGMIPLIQQYDKELSQDYGHKIL